MQSNPKSWKDFSTYKKRFEFFSPIFYLAKLNIVPMSFYLKYCKKLMIIIINYGMGNLGSLQNMFNYIDVKSQVTPDPDLIFKSKKIVLPGVGSFKKAMKKLNLLMD